MSKVLLIHRYFRPDTPPYATMLGYIAKHLADKHVVKVLSTQPSYKSDLSNSIQPTTEIVDGYTINRLKVPKENRKNISTRLWSTFIYLIKVFFAILRERPDIVMVSTAPAVLSGFTVQCAARITKSRFFYHCQDIHPEIAALSGQLNNGFTYKVLRYLDNLTCKRADKIIVISNDMAQSLLDRKKINKEKIFVISNFSLDKKSEAVAKNTQNILLENKFNILFAGNIGKFQALDVVLELAKSCGNEENLHFNLMGSGTYLEHIRARVKTEKIPNVSFLPHMPIEKAREAMQEASLCIVSLNQKIYKYAYPSKTLTYLAEGKPLLCIVEDDSQLANLVNSKKIGISFSHDNISAAKLRLLNLVSNQENYQLLCENAERYFNTELRKEKILESWGRLYRE